MRRAYALAARLALVILLLCVVTLFFVGFHSAEGVITVLSIVMCAIVFLVSVLKLRKDEKEDE